MISDENKEITLTIISSTLVLKFGQLEIGCRLRAPDATATIRTIWIDSNQASQEYRETIHVPMHWSPRIPMQTIEQSLQPDIDHLLLMISRREYLRSQSYRLHFRSIKKTCSALQTTLRGWKPASDQGRKASRQTLFVRRRWRQGPLWRNGFQFARKAKGLSGMRESTEI